MLSLLLLPWRQGSGPVETPVISILGQNLNTPVQFSFQGSVQGRLDGGKGERARVRARARARARRRERRTTVQVPRTPYTFRRYLGKAEGVQGIIMMYFDVVGSPRKLVPVPNLTDLLDLISYLNPQWKVWV